MGALGRQRGGHQRQLGAVRRPSPSSQPAVRRSKLQLRHAPKPSPRRRPCRGSTKRQLGAVRRTSRRRDYALVLFGGVLQVQLKQPLQQLVVADVRLPTVGREHRNVQVAVEVVEPRWPLVVELREGELRVVVEGAGTSSMQLLWGEHDAPDCP